MKVRPILTAMGTSRTPGFHGLEYCFVEGCIASPLSDMNPWCKEHWDAHVRIEELLQAAWLFCYPSLSKRTAIRLAWAGVLPTRLTPDVMADVVGRRGIGGGTIKELLGLPPSRTSLDWLITG